MIFESYTSIFSHFGIQVIGFHIEAIIMLQFFKLYGCTFAILLDK